MTTAAAPSSRAVLAFLPLAGVLVVLVTSAVIGHGGLLPRASAANTVEVTGLVDEIVYIDATGCSSASALNIGDLIPNDPWKATTADCVISFGTSNASVGANLTVREDPTAPGAAGDAMRCIEASCTAAGYDGAIDDVTPNATVPAAGTSAFGATLRSTSGVATSDWTTSRVNPIGASSTACHTAGIGDGTCAFGFGAASAADDGPGSYRAQAQFLVLAR